MMDARPFDFRVVPFTRRHVPAAAELERECFSDPWSQRAIDEMLANPNAYCIAAERCGEQELIGYAGMYVSPGEADIANIAVAPRFRRHGVATALLGELVGHARDAGVGMIFLEVRSRNGGAIALYEKFGFVRVGVRRSYYRRPADDALVMRANIDD